MVVLKEPIFNNLYYGSGVVVLTELTSRVYTLGIADSLERTNI